MAPVNREELAGVGLRTGHMMGLPLPMFGTGIAAEDQFRKAELGLSDQEYYDKYIAPYARAKYQQAVGEQAPMRRGAKKSQGQIVAAQFGGQPSYLGEAATTSMAPMFRRAMARALERGRVGAESYEAEAMKKRQREVAKALETVSSVSSLESGLASMIPYVGPYLGAGLAAGGAAVQAGARGERAKMNRQPLRTVGFDETGAMSGPGVSQGGGGLYDLYNLSYG